MKIICTAKKWPLNKDKDTSSALLKICFANKLIPDYLQNYYESFLSHLSSGISTIRNRESGHGKTEVVHVPDHFADYMLNITGSTIKFFVECYKNAK